MLCLLLLRISPIYAIPHHYGALLDLRCGILVPGLSGKCNIICPRMPRFCSRRTFTSRFSGYYQFQTKSHLRGAFSLEHCGDCRDARDTFFPRSYLFSLVYPNNGKRTKGILIRNPSFFWGGVGFDKVQRCTALNVCVCSPE